MIDTLRLNLHGRWNEQVPTGSEWERTERTTSQFRGQERSDFNGVMWQDHGTGLRVGGHEMGPTWAEVSLPRLVHDDNGRLLKSQEEVDAALAVLSQKVNSLAETSTISKGCYDVARVDAVWNVIIPGGVDVVINQLRKVRHPEVRKATRIYDRESIHFPGKGQHLRIYDKSWEKHKRRSDVVRCELQVKGDYVDRVFERSTPYMGGMGASSIDGLRAYRYLSSFCGQLGSMTIPRVASSTDFICRLYHEGLRDSRGVLVVDSWLATLSPRTRCNWQRRFRDYRPKTRRVQWLDVLPPLLPPEAVDVAA